MAFGVGAGLLSGMFGLGGGIIIIPGLMFALKMDQRLAHGTSLGGVYADLVTFTIDGSAVTSERVAVASGTINQFIRVKESLL
jgi:uncharacterized membrane protein YfcA